MQSLAGDFRLTHLKTQEDLPDLSGQDFRDSVSEICGEKMKNLIETELAQITSLDGAPLDVRKVLRSI